MPSDDDSVDDDDSDYAPSSEEDSDAIVTLMKLMTIMMPTIFPPVLPSQEWLT
jgi:hypothetical protein